jgi:hypothetical protein
MPPQMRMAAPKHEINKNAEMMKPHYCPFQISAMPGYPPSYAMPHQMAVQVQQMHDPKFITMQKKQPSQKSAKSGKNKEKDSSSVEEVNERGQCWQFAQTREPPFLITLSALKDSRSQIP